MREIKAGEQERCDRKSDRGRLRQSLICFQCNKRKQTDKRKQKLCGSLDENVDDNAGGRERARYRLASQQCRAHHVAADLRDG